MRWAIPLAKRSFAFCAFQLFAVAVISTAPMSSAGARAPLLLADPTVPLHEAWAHQSFGAATRYERVSIEGVPAIRAIGRESASGLYRDTPYRVEEHPWLEWTWRVDRLQETADIRVKSREDFAAAIFLIFGRPGMINREVPTLAYVWTSSRLPVGAMVASPHHPGSVRSIVVRSGATSLGRWQRERRNVLEDFRAVFGQEPPDSVEIIALFTDNDQTGESVEAYYGAIRALGDDPMDAQ
jgi:hypothetical protein